MSLLSRLFGKRRPTSPLESFLEKTTFDSSRQIYGSVSEQSMKLPSAVSIWVLHLSHRFCLGLRDMLERLDKSESPVAIEGAIYDSVAVEAASYCFFHLMDDLLGESEDEDEEDKKDDSYLSVLRTSAMLANSVLGPQLATRLDDDYLLKRVITYSSAKLSKKTNSLEKFIAVLLSSIDARQPVLRVSSPPVNLVLQLTMLTYTPIFHSAS